MIRMRYGVENERDDALDRAEKAESRFEDDKDLGGELREVNAHLGQVSAELRNAKMQIKQLEDDPLPLKPIITDLFIQTAECAIFIRQYFNREFISMPLLRFRHMM